LYVKLDPGVSVTNLRYAFITAAEAAADPGRNGAAPPDKVWETIPGGKPVFQGKIINQVWEGLATKRKTEGKTDEFFDLSKDVEMANNLVDRGKLKSVILQYRRLVFSAYDYFSKRGKQLLKGTMKSKKLTPEEEKVLKSLGYL
ncbi:MAG: hypothetical protein GY940_10400, partial [bacterium]|nr:hypothetical protein [bacterium]